MSTTTEATPTIDDLRARLEAEQADADTAERELGAAALDSPNPRTASKRVAETAAAVARTRAAIRELERREQERERHELEVAAARDRQRSYVWSARYMEACVEVQRLQEQLQAAGARLGEVSKGIPRPVGVVKEPGLGRPLAWDISTIDEGLIRGLPASRSMGPGRGSHFPISGYEDLPDKWSAGPDELEARIARARALAAIEAEKLAQLER